MKLLVFSCFVSILFVTIMAEYEHCLNTSECAQHCPNHGHGSCVHNECYCHTKCGTGGHHHCWQVTCTDGGHATCVNDHCSCDH